MSDNEINSNAELKRLRDIQATIGEQIRKAEYDLCIQNKGNESICRDERIDKIKNNEAKEAFSDTKIYVDNLIEIIKSQLMVAKSLPDFKLYKETEKKYTKKLNNDLIVKNKKAKISNRLSNFYSKKTGINESWLYYLKLINWLLVFVLIFLFIMKNQYKIISFWPMILLVLFFPLIFMKSLSFRIPIIDKEIRFRSVLDFIYENFENLKIDNIYFISIVVILGLIGIFTYVSKLPFKELVEPS